MHTIHKFPLAVAASQTVTMPSGAELLSVQAQHGTPMLWARVDTDAPPEHVNVLIRGTGHLFDTELPTKFLGTFQLEGGALVFHAFQETP